MEPKEEEKSNIDQENLLSNNNQNEDLNAVVPSMMLEDPECGEKDDRMGFIRKVYGILSCQLIFTSMCITAVQVDQDLHDWM